MLWALLALSIPEQSCTWPQHALSPATCCCHKRAVQCSPGPLICALHDRDHYGFLAYLAFSESLRVFHSEANSRKTSGAFRLGFWEYTLHVKRQQVGPAHHFLRRAALGNKQMGCKKPNSAEAPKIGNKYASTQKG